MTTPAEQVAILADICDAADPGVHPEEQINAALRAAKADPEFAVVAATSLMRGLIEGIGETFGPEHVAKAVAGLRAKVAQFPG